MGDRPSFLERLSRLLGESGDDGTGPTSKWRGTDGGESRGCDDAPSVTCREAASRVYEFLDGELDEQDMRSIRCHLETCRRCYPMYDWERLFLDAVTERGSRPEANEVLRNRIARLLERDPPT